MSNIKREIAVTVAAAALCSTVLIFDAMAECKVVKEDPNCWGDTCATKTVCTPDPAWKQESKKWTPPDESQTSDAWLREQATPMQATKP
jgi:hypothetical protein